MRPFVNSIAMLISTVAVSLCAGEGKWSTVKIGTAEDLMAVCFPSKKDGWIVGRKGLIFKTNDCGKTWSKQNSGLKKSDLYSVFFLDASNGWISGGIGDGPKTRGHLVGGRPFTAAAVLKTIDGGKTWQKIWAPTNFALPDIWMIDKQRGVIVSHGGRRHADGDTVTGAAGGTKWRTRRAFRGLHAVQFVDPNTGYAVGSRVSVGFLPTPKDPLYVKMASQIIKTTNGGKTWAPLVHKPLGRGADLTGLSFVNATTGWACGAKGFVLHTEDGGKGWTKQNAAGTKTHLADCFALDSKHAWLVGEKGVILQTLDSGKTWRKISSSTQQDLRSVCFTGPNHGVAVGGKGTVLIYQGSP